MNGNVNTGSEKIWQGVMLEKVGAARGLGRCW